MNSKTYKVPQVFFDDHINRSNEPQTLIDAIEKTSGRYYLVSLTEAQADELLSDANYYADGVDYAELQGVMRSAQATVRALTESK